MDLKKAKQLLVKLAIAFWVLVIMIYAVASDQFHQTTVTSDALTPSTTIGEIVDGMTVTQRITAPADQSISIELLAGTYGRINSGTMHLQMTDAAGNVIVQKDVDISSFVDGKYTVIPLDVPTEKDIGSSQLLTITTTGCDYGNAVTLYCGNMVTAGRFDIVKNIAKGDLYTINGQQGIGMLCIKVNGVEQLMFYRWYWVIVTTFFVVCALTCLHWWRDAKKGKNNPVVAVCTLYTRYGFLLKQLVSRDFKTKYKRSVLGVAWSLLNPLLTMGVQYVVFSTLFKSDIPNYPVYLLSGIVFMSFFNETVSTCMASIIGNASLIKKVYMPKYIYPVSRVISSLVNFVIALIPLLLMMIVTGIPFRPSLLLLVFDILCLLGFVTGMGLMLTTIMTFFQDTQFLWGIVSMMWMYLTPVFYPESIIPVRFLTLYHANPMYQYITFARICIIDGGSPAPATYFWCLLSSVVVLLIGIVVFRKNQDKFVMYL